MKAYDRGSLWGKGFVEKGCFEKNLWEMGFKRKGVLVQAFEGVVGFRWVERVFGGKKGVLKEKVLA
jgi:hypothetical protein